MEDKRSFRIPLYSGLLTDGHPARIGGAIWVFLWMIDKTTEEKDIEIEGKIEKLGVVLGGEPVSHKRIAAELKTSEDTIMRSLSLLEKENYIITQRHNYGKVYFVRKSKKWDERYRKPAVSVVSDTAKLRHPDTAKVRYLPRKALLLSTTATTDINKLPERHSTTEALLLNVLPVSEFLVFKSLFIKKWNELAEKEVQRKPKSGKIPAIMSIAEKSSREKRLRDRWREKNFTGNLDRLFEEIPKSAMLCGRSDKPSPGHENWKITVDWLIGTDKNYLKVLEGNYRDGPGKGKSQMETLMEIAEGKDG